MTEETLSGVKCINKKRLITLLICLIFSINSIGCGKFNSDDKYISYDVYESSDLYSITNNSPQYSNQDFFAKNLAVASSDDIGVSTVDSQVAGAGAAFNLDTNSVVYAQNIHGRIYPASTTKIMTCLVTCLYADLDTVVTVSENAVNQPDDSALCGLKAKDTLTIRDLLYGLMLRSGNDAAISIAEAVSGDIESFAELMNQTAYALGATNTHFVNPNGMHDENHYTTCYDMYLILNAALKNEEFKSIFTSNEYTAVVNRDGKENTLDWTTTIQYHKGKTPTPTGFTILGGKTGTTGAAGYCLVLLSENERGETIISVVFHADCRSNLYLLMNQILSGYCA